LTKAKRGRPMKKEGRKRLIKILDILTNSAKPISKNEIAEKIGEDKTRVQFMLSNYRTSQLFTKHQINKRLSNYSLSAIGHCANETNDFMRRDYKPEEKKPHIVDTLMMTFFKITKPRCKPWAC